jgi:hypothetical protein
MSEHTIASSDGNSLHFKTTEEYLEYKEDELRLFFKHHLILKDKYGIWASNQNKYVDSVDDLNDFDSKQHVTR